MASRVQKEHMEDTKYVNKHSRRHDAEFKQNAVDLVLSKRMLKDVGRDLGVSYSFSLFTIRLNALRFSAHRRSLIQNSILINPLNPVPFSVVGNRPDADDPAV